MQIKSRFKISQSLVIVVLSWKSRFKICQSQELEVQVESPFLKLSKTSNSKAIEKSFQNLSKSRTNGAQKRKSF